MARGADPVDFQGEADAGLTQMSLPSEADYGPGRTLAGSASSQTDDDDDKYPPIDISIPGPFEVKWILPDRASQMYGVVKAFAEGAGYETVELDDFSYPPPRV